MEGLAVRLHMLDVVHRHRGDLPFVPIGAGAIGQRLGGGDGRLHRGRGDDVGARLAQRLDIVGVHMVAMNVGDQDQVTRRQAANIRRLGGINIDALAARFDHHGGMIDGRDVHRPGRGGEGLDRSRRSQRGESGGGEQQRQADGMTHVFSL